MRSFRTKGIIIKRRNTGEADKILTVFTHEFGKLQIKAIGIRRIASRRCAHVELLNYSALGLYKGPNNTILTEANAIDSFSAIKDDLDKVGYAYHLCELVDGLCPENQENKTVFTLLKNMLTQIACHSSAPLCNSKYSWGAGGNPYSTNSIPSAIHGFEIELLSILGYWNKEDTVFDKVDTRNFIESILERKLKSCNIFGKML